MKYIPLRVYSVFSRGKGAISAAGFADFLRQKKISCLALSDPFSMIGWEDFYKESKKKEMKPLLGLEIRLQRIGSLILFPVSIKGYFSLISSFNRKKFSGLDDVIVILFPSYQDSGTVMNIKTQIAPGNLFVGIDWHTERWLVQLAKDYRIPMVWAQPFRWIDNPEKYAVVSSVFNHRPIPEVLNPRRGYGLFPLDGPLAYQAIKKRWGVIGEEAMKNTFEISSRIEFDFSRLFIYQNNEYARLERLITSRIKREHLNSHEKRRVSRELKIIKEMGFASYFLIASEIGSHCKRNKIYFNLRGSGASSFVLYLMGLSRINPLKYNLIFERFINRLRDDPPDIDVDIDSSRRLQVLNWVFKNYKSRVAFLSTHKFFRARSALYEVARSYGFNPEESHKMSKELPMFASPAELRGRGKGRLAEVYLRASFLEGVYKELSLHLGGVIFSQEAIKESFPLDNSPGGFEQVVWNKDTVERLKIFKLDLLGVRGFDVISHTAQERKVDFADIETWGNIDNAKTIGCFQLESPLARENLRRARPRNIDELAISLAIIRPGPAKSGMKKSYIEGKPLFHPVFQKIFPYTRGTIIFEEQISLLLRAVTGWNLEYSEKVRKDLKKKKGDIHRKDFFDQGEKHGWHRKDLGKFWKIAADFSLYAFNHSHSISYAYSAYISAWLKSKYPVTFFCRLFNSGGGYYPLPFYIEEAKRWHVGIIPPDVNFSDIGFSKENGSLRTGLIFVKGIGRKLSTRITRARGKGYANLEDFIARTGAGERELSVLMAVSAFKSLGHCRFSDQDQEDNWKRYLGFVPYC